MPAISDPIANGEPDDIVSRRNGQDVKEQIRNAPDHHICRMRAMYSDSNNPCAECIAKMNDI